MIEPTIEEATAIAKIAVGMANDRTLFESFPASLQLQAIAGIMNAIKGMQILGWRVARPLEVVGDK